MLALPSPLAKLVSGQRLAIVATSLLAGGLGVFTKEARTKEGNSASKDGSRIISERRTDFVEKRGGGGGGGGVHRPWIFFFCVTAEFQTADWKEGREGGESTWEPKQQRGQGCVSARGE